MQRKTKNIIADVCRILLGLTFVFSGFVKTVDPWGTALKITEYLNTYGLGALHDCRLGLAVLLCAAELTLGLMLVFGIKTRLTSPVSVSVMVFFTVLTLLSATWMPVEDCGCFGDALKLSPWASVGKNVALLALAAAVWLDARKTKTFLPVTAREWVCTALFACISVGIGAYCCRHLPLIDFLPYRKGVDLYGAIYRDAAAQEEAMLIYRDLNDGSLHEFAVSDTTWYDTARWEFVGQVEREAPADGVALREFAVFNSEGDATREITAYPGRVYILAAMKLDEIKPRCAEKFAKVAERAVAEGAKVILITASPISPLETAAFGDTPAVPLYNVDATTMITMLRAGTGMVVLDGGVIADKKNCRDIE